MQQISDSGPSETVLGLRSILVVDEEGQTSQTLRESLENLGYQVDLLESIDLQLADFDLRKFDLVICDPDTALGLWKVLLDQIGEPEWLEALQLGVFDLLPKPLAKSEV